jgi:tetratricopeptide (TPR) repeat protein
MLAVAIILSLASLYGTGVLYASSVSYNDAVAHSNNADIEGTKSALLDALSRSSQDRYYRLLTAVELASLQKLVQSGSQDKKTQDAFRETLGRAIEYSAHAVGLNPNNIDNWMTRAAVYAAVVPLNIEGAFENSIAALDEARKRSPSTPEIDLRIAEMRQIRGERAQAKAAAEASLKIKEDYTPAILLLAQFSFEEGRLSEAVKSVQSAVFLEPQNPLLFYQLGLLLLQAKEYQGAATAFEGALKLNSDYANATFFLGESYVFLGKSEDALAVLRPLYQKNESSDVLKSVIAAIEKGENPFAAKPSPTPDEKKPVE